MSYVIEDRFKEEQELEQEWLPRLHPYRLGLIALMEAENSGGDFYELNFGILRVRAFNIGKDFYLHSITSHWLKRVRCKSEGQAKAFVEDERSREMARISPMIRTSGSHLHKRNR
jgi:hypothetical protein